ncbi:MAG: magnesium/cobalt transporter CorA [Planctomycetota bacterium]
MREHGQHSSEKAGLPPGQLVHIGRKWAAVPKVSIIDYDKDKVEQKKTATIAKCAPYKDKPTVTWISVEGVEDTRTLRKIGEAFDLHPLTMEDIVNTHQRPKLEDYGHYVFVVLKMLRSDLDTDQRVRATQVSLVMGKGFVISFQEGGGNVLDPVRERIQRNKGPIRSQGADYLLYALVDAITDSYFTILEGLGEKMDTLEERLLADPSPVMLRFIQGTKRDLILLRRSIWPLRDVVASITRGGSDLVEESTHVYLRDVHDHSMRLVDHIETNRERLAGMLDIYLSSVSNRMNAVMKVLTIIATIFIPLSFFAGVYGMNFRNMPEYGWKYGYAAFWAVMLAIVIGMMVFFKRRKWI